MEKSSDHVTHFRTIIEIVLGPGTNCVYKRCLYRYMSMYRYSTVYLTKIWQTKNKLYNKLFCVCLTVFQDGSICCVLRKSTFCYPNRFICNGTVGAWQYAFLKKTNVRTLKNEAIFDAKRAISFFIYKRLICFVCIPYSRSKLIIRI